MYPLNKAKQKQLAFLSAFYFTIAEITHTKRKLTYAVKETQAGLWVLDGLFLD